MLFKNYLAKIKYSTWAYILLGCTLYFFTKELPGCGDFHVFYLAIKGFWNGDDVYTTWYQNLRYFYSPLFAIVFTPFTFIDVQVAAWIWKFINILLLYRLWVLLVAYFPTDLFHKKDSRKLALFTFVAALFPLYLTLHNYQVTIFMVWGVFESLRFYDRKKYWQGAVLLAFMINMKIMPIVFLFYFIYRARWKEFGYTVLMVVVYLFLPAIVIGWDRNTFLLSQWFHLINPSKVEHVFDVTETGLCSITTLLTTLLHDGNWDPNYTFRRHLVVLPPAQVALIIQLVRVIIVAFTLYFLRTKPFVKEENKLKEVWEIGYIMLATFLVFPHQQQYGLFFAFPTMMYLAYASILHYKSMKQRFWRRGWLTILTYFMIGSEFYLGNFRRVIKYLKLITWGALLTLIPYSYYTPKRLENYRKDLEE